MHWVSRIQAALREDRFELYSQLIQANARTDEGPHFEILLRMRDEKGEILSPEAFLPAAENYSLMVVIDRWVTSHTLATLCEYWPKLKDLGCLWSINISGQSVDDEFFLEFVIDALLHSGVALQNIGFEITESVAGRNLESAQQIINGLRDVGSLWMISARA